VWDYGCPSPACLGHVASGVRAPGGTLRVDRLRRRVSARGGAIYSTVAFTMSNPTFTSNQASGGSGRVNNCSAGEPNCFGIGGPAGLAGLGGQNGGSGSRAASRTDGNDGQDGQPGMPGAADQPDSFVEP